MSQYTPQEPEIWKPAPSFPGYDVSNQGQVRSWKAHYPQTVVSKPHLKPLYKSSSGYMQAVLQSPLGSTRVAVHRLVLTAFVGPCPDGYEACHNNGNRQDNRLENLRWDTRVHNFADREKHGHTYRGERHHLSHLTASDILTIRQRAATGECHRHIAADYGMSRAAISYIVRRFTWKHVP